jgi:hypothetical protein
VHLLGGVLTLWPETFLGNTARFQRLLHRSARLVLNSLSLKFPTEIELVYEDYDLHTPSTRSTRYVFIYALFKPYTDCVNEHTMGMPRRARIFYLRN